MEMKKMYWVMQEPANRQNAHQRDFVKIEETDSWEEAKNVCLREIKSKKRTFMKEVNVWLEN
jgi:hypothetical protein